jgi:hypothetical protein
VLPDRCLITKQGINYVRGFREYFGYKSIQNGELNTRLHYDNNVKALLNAVDCPSIESALYNFWNQKIEYLFTIHKLELN